MTKLTYHAQDRMKERAGLRGDAQKKMADKAMSEGAKPADFAGSLRRYLDGLARRDGAVVRLYGEKVYLFASDRLVTVLNLPRKFAAAANRH